jgi:AraC-like DNA-binding protein
MAPTKPRARSPEWDSMWRGTFGLTPQDPVMLMRAEHTVKGEPHYDMHYEVEIGIVLRGAATRHYQDWRTGLRAAGTWLCGMWEPHGLVLERTPLEMVVLVVSPDFLATLAPPGVDWLAPFVVPPQARPPTHARNRSAVLAVAEKLLSVEAMPPGPARQAWLQTLCAELLLTLTEGWQPRGALSPDRALIHRRLEPGLRLALNARRLVTEAEAARACAMGRNTFCRRFHATMGISFARFALRHRLRAAAQRLCDSDTPVKAIAADWGFTDASHLHRIFARHYGCAPAEYRRRAGA